MLWSSDPVHGDTVKSSIDYKTRIVDDVLKEVKGFFGVHAGEGTYAGGVHFEMAGQNITECMSGAHAISAEDLHDRYHTAAIHA